MPPTYEDVLLGATLLYAKCFVFLKAHAGVTSLMIYWLYLAACRPSCTHAPSVRSLDERAAAVQSVDAGLRSRERCGDESHAAVACTVWNCTTRYIGRTGCTHSVGPVGVSGKGFVLEGSPLSPFCSHARRWLTFTPYRLAPKLTRTYLPIPITVPWSY